MKSDAINNSAKEFQDASQEKQAAVAISVLQSWMDLVGEAPLQAAVFDYCINLVSASSHSPSDATEEERLKTKACDAAVDYLSYFFDTDECNLNICEVFRMEDDESLGFVESFVVITSHLIDGDRSYLRLTWDDVDGISAAMPWSKG